MPRCRVHGAGRPRPFEPQGEGEQWGVSERPLLKLAVPEQGFENGRGLEQASVARPGGLLAESLKFSGKHVVFGARLREDAAACGAGSL